MKSVLLWCTLYLAFSNGFAATVKDRAGAVRNDRATLESDARWIYNDFQKGFAEAKRTGKPLLVVLRCIPCLACAGIDSAVLLQETDLAPLLDKFVCVRVIDANALDLKLFQFDYDLSFSTLFFNGDGTVYGRYGSWRHQKDPQDKTTAGFKRALEAALEIHRGYPANKAGLAGKQGGPLPFKRPVDIPSLAAKYKPELDWEGQVVQSCIHCHQVGEALRQEARASKKTLPLEMIYPWPNPEAVGIVLAADHVARVESVAAGSVAEKSGLKAGDDLVSLAGQPLISVADVSWVLHQAPQAGALPVSLTRDGRPTKLNWELPGGWRERTDISRRVSIWNLRMMATGGLVLEDLPEDNRSKLGLAHNQMGFLVKGVGQYGKNAAGKEAGFKKDDVIVELDNQTARMTEGELLGYLLQHHAPGERIKAVVLRGAERVELGLPMQ
jgi:serine protease Do